MRRTTCVTAAFLALLLYSSGIALAENLPGIPPQTVADYLHAVIEADRTFYTVHVVERQQRQGGGRRFWPNIRENGRR